MTISTVSPAALAAIVGNGKTIDLIDVRTPAEYQARHVAMAENVPLDRLDPVALMRARNGSRCQAPLYIVCQAGGRGKQACEKFIRAGYSNAINVEGGTLACEQAGLPIVRGKKVISMERQVRIVAGSIVVLGALLSWLVHPAVLAVPALVGAGLVFSGVSDTCGMALLLARMPWNGSGKSNSGCSVG